MTVQKSYGYLKTIGIIETNIGRRSFISYKNKDLFKKYQNNIIENYLKQTVEIL